MSRITRALLALALLALAAPASAAAAPTLVPVGELQHADATSPRRRGDASRLFVVERGGAIRVVRDGVTLAAPVPRHLGRRRHVDGERGLLSMAFAPDYAQSGLFYVYMSRATRTGELQVREYRRSAANPDVADPDRADRRVWYATHPARPTTTAAQIACRARRLPVARDRRRRWRRRRVRPRADALQPARQGAADRPAPRQRAGELHGPAPATRLRHRGVGVRAAQPVPLLVRPRHRRPA